MSLFGAVLGLATPGVVAGRLRGLKVEVTGIMRDELYPMPIAGGEPETVVEIVVDGTVDREVDGTVAVSGKLSSGAKFEDRIPSFLFISRSSGGTGYTGFNSGGVLLVISSRLWISFTSWRFWGGVHWVTDSSANILLVVRLL